MSQRLRDTEVLVLDCQASGATPKHGDLLELGWAACSLAVNAVEPRSQWLIPRTERRIPGAIRELTGWSEARLIESLPETAVWAALQEDVRALAARTAMPRVPTLIHFARFELPFLHDLHERLGAGEFPLHVRCLHAVAARLFPELPRRNIRALAGHLGHSPGLSRRALGHVEATAFIWRALVPRLEQLGVLTWEELDAWLAHPAPRARGGRRVFPVPAERRRALPKGPGVYRFTRCNGDILYVGKATSLRKRVAGHFKSSGPHTERALELLSQVHDIVVTETASTLEAALLESDEIKTLDPPYNVQLRLHDRAAWFAERASGETVPVPDARHRVGPLPSRRALLSLPALVELARGEPATARLRALALAVPAALVPEAPLFAAGWSALQAELLDAAVADPVRRLERAALAVWLSRRHGEVDESSDELPENAWDLPRVRRRLERSLVHVGLLMRRARWLSLLCDADVAFRERGMLGARLLVLSRGELVGRQDLERVSALSGLSRRSMGSIEQRRACFDAARYDRMRVLSTELYRVLSEGGELALRFGSHLLSGERLASVMRTV